MLMDQKIKHYRVKTRYTYNMDEKCFAIGRIGRFKRLFDKALY